MYIENHVLRELYLSDVISPDDEMMMLSGIDDSYFDLIEELIHKFRYFQRRFRKTGKKL